MNAEYSDTKFTQLRTCWTMSDQNSLTIKGNVTKWSQIGKWSDWVECDGACPSSTDDTEIDTSFLYRVKFD